MLALAILKKIWNWIKGLFSNDINVEYSGNTKSKIVRKEKIVNKPKIKNKGQIGDVNIGNTISIDNSKK